MAKKPTPFPSIQKKPELPKADPRMAFFMVSALAYYRREDQQKQRHLNVLAQLPPTAQITKEALETISRTVVARICAENALEPTDIQDVVLNSITLLGIMPPAEFDPKLATAPVDQTRMPSA